MAGLRAVIWDSFRRDLGGAELPVASFRDEELDLHAFGDLRVDVRLAEDLLTWAVLGCLRGQLQTQKSQNIDVSTFLPTR